MSHPPSENEIPFTDLLLLLPEAATTLGNDDGRQLLLSMVRSTHGREGTGLPAVAGLPHAISLHHPLLPLVRNLASMDHPSGAYLLKISNFSRLIISYGLNLQDIGVERLKQRTGVSQQCSNAEGRVILDSTYDLLHAWLMFSEKENHGCSLEDLLKENHRCSLEDLLTEMYRVMRPHGYAIITL
ncbi:hypothetical protein QYE76_047967 [Lolium multiflorum]|uniref:Uncharacterized protein n=1 Tax=Lolium multiflorum TaxID=4521 RepID=A0AAD8TSY0_LOLMU|nr:hypothetical protein QYE76_047967 [Lolium multiflorum]